MTQTFKHSSTLNWPEAVEGPPPAAPVPARPGWQSGAMPAIFAGIAAIAAGLFMPWITIVAPFIGQISRNGIDTSDGKIAALVALVLAGLTFLEVQTPHAATRVIMLVGVIAIGVVVVVDYSDIASRVAEVNADDFGHGEVGIGLYLMGAGVVGAAIALVTRMATFANR